MMFGSKDSFAIEAYAERTTGRTLWGRMCVWLQGTPIGDISVCHTGLSDVFEEFKAFLIIALSLWEPKFTSLSDLELLQFLDEKYYGYRGDVEIKDAQSNLGLERDSAKYAKYNFLTNSGEQFNRVKCFIFAPPGKQFRVLRWNPDSKAAESFVIDQQSTLRAMSEFISWYEKQIRSGKK